MEKTSIHLSRKLQDSALLLLKNNIRLKEGEKVLLITDRISCPIFTSISAAVAQLGGVLTEAYISNEREHSSPIPSLRDKCMDSDVIIGVTDKSISHSPEVSEARKKGTRVVSMPGITEELFIEGVNTDPSRIKKINSRLMRSLQNPREIKLFSASGSIATIDMRDSVFDFSDDGDASIPGKLINLPYGEVYSFISNCNGKIFIDFWDNKIRPNQKAMIEVENGKIVGWNNAASQYVMNQLNAGECGLQIAEFGIGTNPNHKKPIGNILYDEKIFGTVHIAFGSGKRKCSIHEDFIILQPTVLIDGEELMRRGRLVR